MRVKGRRGNYSRFKQLVGARLCGVVVDGGRITGVRVGGVQRGAIGRVHPSHGHVGTVDKENEDSQQADQGTQHAETDDATATQVHPLDDVAPQEGAPPTSRYHHVTWRGELYIFTVYTEL